ncbi:MAG: 1,4-dihydroxy-2-naphthoate octaprenyltransferase [Anaerolineae bacterium]|nr:1,4-dihydroxy-2-naphthoate octaprenyltransferase [Candidatus Roseilinea sp.]MDW8451252.1 1,4-dihydroxy-2-naphthoate octaprenyltransferase [Anaerolineae bacterium]
MARERWLTLVSPLVLLALWEALARASVLDPRFFSMPSEIFARLIVLLQDGTLLANTAITLRRVAVGFVLATVPAILLGVAMGVSGVARALFTPLVAAIYPVPKIALVPMVVLLLGIGEPAKYAIVVISVFFLVALNTVAGVRNVDPRYFDIARNNGASKWDLIWTVALPGALPSILTGVSLGLGFALTVIVGTELLLPQGGLGAMIWAAYQVYDIPTIFAALIVVALLGFAANWLMGEVERQLVPWQANVRSLDRSNVRTKAEPRIRRFVRVWWMATRPFSFTASVVPVTLGAVLAAYDGYFDLWLFALTLIGSVLIHAGTNLANDYYDWKKGADTPESLGPNRALQEGMLTPQQVFIGALVCFGVGSLIGLYLVAARGVFILMLGILSVLAGWFYTAGPKAFAYIGLGEIVVFIFMGPVMVIGSYYVQVQAAPLHVVLLSLPIGFLVAAILHANNMRDLEGDLAKNKRTLANILGRQASKWEYLVLVVGSFVVLIALVLIGYAPLLALLPLLVLPTGISLVQRAFATDEPRKLNRVLRATASLHGWFGWLMILGFVGAIVGRLVY